jgi:hypothetical protein
MDTFRHNRYSWRVFMRGKDMLDAVAFPKLARGKGDLPMWKCARQFNRVIQL